MSIAIALTLHLIAINIWVGGMFFVVVVFNHVTVNLERALLYATWYKALSRFFSLIWLAMALLLATGGWMIRGIYGGVAGVPLHILLMATLGSMMMAVFVFTYFAPYRKFRQALQRRDYEACDTQLEKVRLLGRVNMVIGLCVVIVIGAGPHYLV